VASGIAAEALAMDEHGSERVCRLWRDWCDVRGLLAEDVGEGVDDSRVVEFSAGGDAQVTVAVEAPFVGAVAYVDAVPREQLGGDRSGGRVELEQREVRRARVGLDAGQCGEAGEQLARVTDVASAGLLVFALVAGIAEQFAEPFGERVEVPQRGAAELACAQRRGDGVAESQAGDSRDSCSGC
jgi:hypothetical protein